MKTTIKYFFYSVIVFGFQHANAQYVGVGTSTPAQTLHLASPTGTLRVESLSHQYNVYNGGDTDNDNDLTDEKFPLYVDENGEFSLEFKPFFNSGKVDAFDGALPQSSVTLLASNANGFANTVVNTYQVTVTRESVLELKYNISYEIYADSNGNKITDGLARRVTNYVTVTGQTRKYGATSKCYSSTSIYSVVGTYFNSSTTYITLPVAGTYDINIIGEVGSDITGQSGNAPPSKDTHVKFATGQDFIFARLF
jgi:hypothetical protein